MTSTPARCRQSHSSSRPAFTDGHPASSKLDLFEGFVKKIVTEVQANPSLWASTAIFVTFDEGGGNYDSGYVQPIDFFGDGTRIPFIAVSPFSKGGKVDHTYYDHVSIIKFIEKNWGLAPVTGYGRDNLPNPTCWSDALCSRQPASYRRPHEHVQLLVRQAVDSSRCPLDFWVGAGFFCAEVAPGRGVRGYVASRSTPIQTLPG